MVTTMDSDSNRVYRIGGILLAAGVGRRFGRDKRLARLADGRTLLEHALAGLARVCDQTLLVLGVHDDVAALGLQLPAGVVAMSAARSEGGMGFSLADAIIEPEVGSWDGCLVGLADKPFVREQTVRAVRDLLAQHALVVPTHQGKAGHPVGFARCHFAALARMSGDQGARTMIQRLRDEACFVEFDDPGVIADIDTPGDLERLQRRFAVP